MFLAIPVGLVYAPRVRPVASYALAAVLTARSLQGWLDPTGVPSWRELVLREDLPLLLRVTASGLATVTPQFGFVSIFGALMVAMLGPGIEQRVRWYGMLLCWAAGCAVPFALAQATVLKLPDYYDPTAGGFLTIIGLGYLFLAEMDVRVLYVYFLFFLFGTGSTETHPALCLAALHGMILFRHITAVAEDHSVFASGVDFWHFTIVMPILVALCAYACEHAGRTLRKRAEAQPPVVA